MRFTGFRNFLKEKAPSEVAKTKDRQSRESGDLETRQTRELEAARRKDFQDMEQKRREKEAKRVVDKKAQT